MATTRAELIARASPYMELPALPRHSYPEGSACWAIETGACLAGDHRHRRGDIYDD